MNILLTGATGFIGTHLCRHLRPQHHVFALTRNDSLKDDENLTLVRADLSNPETTLMVPGEIDVVIWLAQSRAYREFPQKALDVFAVNVRSVMQALEYARHNGVKRFIFASSANVYKPSHQPISETITPDPTSFYGRSKRIAEMLIESYGDYFNCLLLRLFTVYGPGQVKMLIPSLIERVRMGQPIQLQGESGIKLTPIYVTDTCKIIQATLELDSSATGCEAINVGGNETLGIFEMASIIGHVLGIRPRFERLAREQPGGWTANISKLKETLLIEDLIPFAEGIRRLAYENRNGT